MRLLWSLGLIDVLFSTPSQSTNSRFLTSITIDTCWNCADLTLSCSFSPLMNGPARVGAGRHKVRQQQAAIKGEEQTI